MWRYRAALVVIGPCLLAALLWRVLRGQERRADLAERLGAGPVLPEGAPVIWLHAASNGELTAARPLIEALSLRAAARAIPAPRIAITTNSLSGRDLARDLPVTAAMLAPLDLRWCLSRRLRRLHPALSLTIENELWPNRIALLSRAGVPVAVAGARMSARSARIWGRMRGLMAAMLARLDWVAPLDRDSGARLVALGLPERRLAPVLDLKAAAAAAMAAPPIGPGDPRLRVVLAGSTHPGDEARIAAAMAPLLARDPGLRLIVAPRHPRRADEVAELLSEAGLTALRRSAGANLADLSAAAPVLLADTLGEMARWYGAAGLCVIGGSFDALGGHTPYEPLAAGCGVLHGPDMANFATARAALAPTGAEVTPEDLPARLEALLTGNGAGLCDLRAAQVAALPGCGELPLAAADDLLDILAGLRKCHKNVTKTRQ